MSRVFGANDTGNAFRRTDAAPSKVGGIYKEENGQQTFTDGQGNKIWFADTTSGDVTITLPDATTVAPDTIFRIVRISAGANTLTIQTDGGNIDGTATKTINTQYNSRTIVSNGTQYYIV